MGKNEKTHFVQYKNYFIAFYFTKHESKRFKKFLKKFIPPKKVKYFSGVIWMIFFTSKLIYVHLKDVPEVLNVHVNESKTRIYLF